MSAPLNHPRSGQHQKRRENGSGQRVLVRALVSPEAAANVRALEALDARFWNSRI